MSKSRKKITSLVVAVMYALCTLVAAPVQAYAYVPDSHVVARYSKARIAAQTTLALKALAKLPTSTTSAKLYDSAYEYTLLVARYNDAANQVLRAKNMGVKYKALKNYYRLAIAKARVAYLKTVIKTITPVIILISNLPKTVTLANATQINEANTAFNALTAAQKKLIPNMGELKVAVAALAALNNVTVAGVMAMITALPVPAVLTLADEAKVVAARTAYMALSATDKVLVTNTAVLMAAEAMIVVLKNPVVISVSAITVTGTGGATTVVNGSTLQMSAAVTPANATNKTVTWSVAPTTGTATIGATTGILTGTGNGTVEVTATANNGIVGKATITVVGVTQPPVVVSVSDITVTGNDTVVNGQTLQLGVTVTPDTATNKTVTWSVTNGTESATISATGLLTATGVGTVTVKAVAQDGSLKESTKIITVTGNAVDLLSTAKTAAHTALTTALGTYTSTNYTTGNWTILTGFKTAGDLAINAATDTAGVTTAQTTATVGMSGVATIAGDLAAAKTAAHTALATALGAYTEANYTAENWTTLTGFKTAGDTAIDAATDTAGVTSAQTTATAGMSGVATIAEALATAKTTAHTALTAALATYTQLNYASGNWTILNGFKTAGDTAINAATDIAGVTSAQTTALNAMDAVKTIAETTAEALAAVNAATVDTMGLVITTYSAALGLTPTTLADYNVLTPASKAIVHTALAGKAFANITAVNAAFGIAVSVPIINEITVNITMTSAIARYNSILNLNATSYNTYTAPAANLPSSQSRINAMLMAAVLTSTTDVQAAFDLAVTAEAVNVINIQLFNYMDRDLRTFAAQLGLVLTDYDALINKTPVLTAMVAATFTTAAQVKTTFDSLVAQEKILESMPMMDAFNTATDAVTMGNVLGIYSTLFNATDYNLYNNLVGAVAKTAIQTAMLSPTFLTNKDIQIAFAIGLMNNSSDTNAGQVLSRNSVVLGLATSTVNDEYALIPYPEKGLINSAVLAVKPIADQTEIVIAVFNSTTTSNYIGTLLSLNSELLGLNLTDYNALTNKAPVHIALIDPVFASIADVKAAFDAAVLAQKTAEEVNVTLSSIAITELPIKLDYMVGEPLDLSGLVVTGTYSDGTKKLETVSGADIIGFDSTMASPSQELTILIGQTTTIFTITVNAPAVVAVTGVSLNAGTASIEAGTTQTLFATVAPVAADQSITWTSDNESVATVDGLGIVTGVSPGVAIITVTTIDGSFKATCTITVTASTIVDMFNNAIALPAMVTAIDNYLILNASNPSEGMFWYSNFATPENQLKVQNALLLAPTFTNQIEIQQVFALTAINNVTDAFELNNLIWFDGVILGLDLTDYSNLTDNSPVATALTGKAFTTLTELKTAFDSAVLAQKIKETP